MEKSENKSIKENYKLATALLFFLFLIVGVMASPLYDNPSLPHVNPIIPTTTTSSASVNYTIALNGSYVPFTGSPFNVDLNGKRMLNVEDYQFSNGVNAIESGGIDSPDGMIIRSKNEVNIIAGSGGVATWKFNNSQLTSSNYIMNFFNNKLQTTGDIQGNNIIGNNICYSNGTGCASQGFTTDQNDQLNTTGSPSFVNLEFTGALTNGGSKILELGEHILYAGSEPSTAINFFIAGLIDFYDSNLVTTGNLAVTNISANMGTFNWVDKLAQDVAPATPPLYTLRLYVDYDAGSGFSTYRYKDDGGMVRRVSDNVFIGKYMGVGTLPARSAVYSCGSSGLEAYPLLCPARADNISTMPSIGITLEAIGTGTFGRVISVGVIENIDTNSFNSNQPLYVSDTIAGNLTAIKPITPNLTQEIGTVLVKSATAGKIELVARSLTGNEFGTINNFTVASGSYYFGDGSKLTGIAGAGGNPFDQVLNTTSNVNFSTINAHKLVLGTPLKLTEMVYKLNVMSNKSDFGIRIEKNNTEGNYPLTIEDVTNATGGTLQPVFFNNYLNRVPATNGMGARWVLNGKNSIGTIIPYGDMRWIVNTVTSGSETAEVDWYLYGSGVNKLIMTWTGAVMNLNPGLADWDVVYRPLTTNAYLWMLDASTQQMVIGRPYETDYTIADKATSLIIGQYANNDNNLLLVVNQSETGMPLIIENLSSNRILTINKYGNINTSGNVTANYIASSNLTMLSYINPIATTVCLPGAFAYNNSHLFVCNSTARYRKIATEVI